MDDKQYLDLEGLQALWRKIADTYLSVNGGVVSGDITADGIISGSLIVNGASRFNGAVYATTFTGNLSGNASTATTATKLGTSTVGGTTTPIYLNNGVPTALSYTLGTSVPSDAKFTDHEYSTATSSVLGLVKSSTTGTTANRNYAVEVKSDGTMKVNVPWENTTYSVATTEANGLMSASDKVKLDGLPEVANLPYAMVSNGFVTTVKVGTTEYTTSNDGVISLPAYPTTLPASDVSAWAKATTKPSYSWSEIGSRPTKLSQFTDDLGSSPTHTHSQYLTSHQSLANYVTLNGAQTISGKKTFTGDIVVGSCTLHYDSTNACLQFNF